MAIKIQIVAEDKATPVVNKALDNTRKKSDDAAGKIKDRFRDVFENVSQNATGSFGSVAGGLFKLPGLAGIAAGAILGIVGALGAMALKSAQATAATNSDSAKFLATIEKVKNGIAAIASFIGSAVIPVFNALASAFGLAATKQETLLAQAKAYREAIIANVKSTDEFVAKLREYLDTTARLTETSLVQAYFKAFSEGNIALAASYQQQITQLRFLNTARRQATIEAKQQTAEIQKQVDVQLETNAAFKIFEQSFQRQNKEALLLLPTLQAIQGIMIGIGIASMQVTGAVQQTVAVLSAQEQIGRQIFSGISQSLAAAVFEGEKLSKVLENILKQLATRALTRLIFGGLTNILTGGALGAIGSLFGGFQHGGSFTVGGMGGIDQNLVAFRASRGERVTITPASQSTVNNVSNAPQISININARNFDRNFVRTELVPLLNREVRAGMDLFASKIK